MVDAPVWCGVRKLFGADVIPQAHFVAGDAELMGANVDHAFQKPQVLHARVATIGAHGTLVCDRLREIYAGVLETVHARENLGPDNATEGLVAGIRKCTVSRTPA